MLRIVLQGWNQVRRWFVALVTLLLVGGAHAAPDTVVYSGRFPETTATLIGATLSVGGVARDVLVYRAASAGANAPVLVFYPRNLS